MEVWKRTNKRPNASAIGSMIFVRDHTERDWEGPTRLVDIQWDHQYPFITESGEGFKFAVLAKKEADLPDYKPDETPPEKVAIGQLVYVRDSLYEKWHGPWPLQDIFRDVKRYKANGYRWKYAVLATEEYDSAAPTETKIKMNGHPSTGVLSQIMADVAQNAQAWKHWQVWRPFYEDWKVPSSLSTLLAVAARTPDRVRRCEPKLHQYIAPRTMAFICGMCGEAFATNTTDLDKPLKCPLCKYEAGITRNEA